MKLKKNQRIVFRRFNGITASGSYRGRQSHVNGDYLEVQVSWRDSPLKIREGQVLSVDGALVSR